jgi:chromosome segregation ATPase
MNRTKMVACALLAVGLVAAGCAKPPQVELDALKAKMAEVQANAQKWAPEAWQKAQDAMNAVNAEVDAQNAKFALLRSYSKAKELITTATTEADAAATAAAEGKTRWQGEAQTAVDAAKAAVAAAETAMADLDKCRRKPKGFSKDMEMMKGNLDALKAQIAALDSAMASEDYQAAKSSADSLKASLDSMAMEMANAKTKIKC